MKRGSALLVMVLLMLTTLAASALAERGPLPGPWPDSTISRFSTVS